MASSSKRYTRSNPDPDPKSPVEDPEKILKNWRYKDQSTSTSIQRSNSLNTVSDRVPSDIKFDTFDYPLLKSKLDTDLKKFVEETCGLDKFIPKSLSQETNSNFWSSPVKEVKRKLYYSKKSPHSNILDSLKKFSKLSSKSQPVNYSVNPILVKSRQIPLVPSQIVPAMANRYAPLVLPANLNPMPIDYGTKIK